MAMTHYQGTQVKHTPTKDLVYTNFLEEDAGEYLVSAGPSTGVTVTSVTPNTGAQGAAVAVTIAGTGFEPTPAVTVSGTGVAVSAVTRVSASSITATFTVAGGATVSARNVTITNLDSSTGTKTGGFSVTL